MTKKLTERERLIEQVWLRSISYTLVETVRGMRGFSSAMPYENAARIADEFIAERQASARVKRAPSKSSGAL